MSGRRPRSPFNWNLADPAALASRPESLDLGAMSEPAFDRSPAVALLDRETLFARFEGIRQFAQGGRRAPHNPFLLLYALARLKHDRVAEVRFHAAEAIVAPLLRSLWPLAQRRPRLVPVQTPGQRRHLAARGSDRAP